MRTADQTPAAASITRHAPDYFHLAKGSARVGAIVGYSDHANLWTPCEVMGGDRRYGYFLRDLATGDEFSSDLRQLGWMFSRYQPWMSEKAGATAACAEAA